MSMAAAIGILPGDTQSYIDHLVPLCSLLEIPLLVTERSIQHLIELYYPPIEIKFVEPEDYDLDPFLKEYDLFVYVDFFRKGNGTFQFQEYTAKKKARSLLSLHGNPDKFRTIYWIENLSDEDIVLAYGPQLKHLIREKGIEKELVMCGNYRLEFYKKHEPFFDQKIPLKNLRGLSFMLLRGVFQGD